MKKTVTDFQLKENVAVSPSCSLLKLTPVRGQLPQCKPGQFVQVRIDGSKSTFLRRPISICMADYNENCLWLLVRLAGAGSASLLNLQPGSIVNLIMPLGNGFTPSNPQQRVLLIGGGVGVAPLLMLGHSLEKAGVDPEFLLGARDASEILLADEFAKSGKVHIATDNGSAGHAGVVTVHPVMDQKWDKIYCCGPAPMMKAVATKARQAGTDCEVSLENMMACGLGACLCCVEKTVKGNVCVCTEGPVFNINELTW
ncbi:MAG: dihydroorotate dehydrogenase electron transfer subunit [Firmicutes bacterium]|nr:dihydroorotate dehydrogenase electron transfer subunit [Bacillota bacterium]MCM1401892.1 dihydroorotate dehydrogenase electron transfer subunit [Bacteroides sp.]MCM1477894.1 dihydroorotate dehydrogenase electron transfer subunit [Bacteroides sp.]